MILAVERGRTWVLKVIERDSPGFEVYDRDEGESIVNRPSPEGRW